MQTESAAATATTCPAPQAWRRTHCARLVRCMVHELVRNIASPSRNLLSRGKHGEHRARDRATRASVGGVRVLGVRAAELVHKVGDHAVEVDTVVVSRLCQVNEARAGDRQLVQQQFSFELPEGCVESCCRVGGCCSTQAPHVRASMLEQSWPEGRGDTAQCSDAHCRDVRQSTR
jgi:hypothetical protein